MQPSKKCNVHQAWSETMEISCHRCHHEWTEWLAGCAMAVASMPSTQNHLDPLHKDSAPSFISKFSNHARNYDKTNRQSTDGISMYIHPILKTLCFTVFIWWLPKMEVPQNGWFISWKIRRFRDTPIWETPSWGNWWWSPTYLLMAFWKWGLCIGQTQSASCLGQVAGNKGSQDSPMAPLSWVRCFTHLYPADVFNQELNMMKKGVRMLTRPSRADT